MTEAPINVPNPNVHPFFDFNDAADIATLPRYDKNELRSRLLDQLETMLLYLFPHGKHRGSRFLVGNLQGEPGDSLVIELAGEKGGVWIDFATGESGDVLTLWAVPCVAFIYHINSGSNWTIGRYS
jgi:hypothetical protein